MTVTLWFLIVFRYAAAIRARRELLQSSLTNQIDSSLTKENK